MKTSTKIILTTAAIILVVGVILIVTINPKEVVEKISPASQFSWQYKKSNSNDLDGMPKTQIFLEVLYKNGKVVLQKIDEVQGSCNDVDVDTEDADMVLGTTKIQCYAAGFGEWYKVIKSKHAYEIVRKNFTEAEPDSIPRDYYYETIGGVPLFQ